MTPAEFLLKPSIQEGRSPERADAQSVTGSQSSSPEMHSKNIFYTKSKFTA